MSSYYEAFERFHNAQVWKQKEQEKRLEEGRRQREMETENWMEEQGLEAAINAVTETLEEGEYERTNESHLKELRRQAGVFDHEEARVTLEALVMNHTELYFEIMHEHMTWLRHQLYEHMSISDHIRDYDREQRGVI